MTLKVPMLIFVLIVALGRQECAAQARDQSRSPSSAHQPVFVLIHSPLVGPMSWRLVADELGRRNLAAVVPTLNSVSGTTIPYWKQHVNAIAEALKAAPPDRPLILLAHSGAGMLLPAIREVTGRKVVAYVFVDAMIPEANKSRLDLFASREAADRFRQNAKNGYLPTWSEQDLRDDIPNAEVRRRFASELKPLPLDVYEEPIPVFAGWPDAPCFYLQFTPTYDIGKQRAQSSGWIYRRMDGGHFLMLVDSKDVTETLLKMLQQAGIKLN